MTLFSEIFAASTLHALILTLRFAGFALVASWVFSLFFVFIQKKFIFSIFRFLWVLPGFGYALITLSSLRFLGVASRYGMDSVLMAWIIAGVPYLALAQQSAIRDLDFRQKEALQSLGAGPVRAFFHFEFLRTLPAQAHALLQQLWLYFTSFSLVMILSGGFPNETLEVSIYTSVRLDHVDMTHAWALGIWQLLILIPLRLLLNRIPSLTQASEWSSTQEHKSKKSLRILWMSSVFLILVSGITWKSGLEIDGLFESLGTSVALSMLVAVLSLSWAAILYRFKMAWFAEIGAWISPMLLTLLWWKQFGFSIFPFLNALTVQVILFSPWIARSLFPVLRRRRQSELEAAESLGCKPLHAWFAVEWPRIRGTVFFTGSLVVSLSFAEVTAVLLFSENQFEPLSVWVQNAFMRFRLQEALLGTGIIVVISLVSLLLGSETFETRAITTARTRESEAR